MNVSPSHFLLGCAALLGALACAEAVPLGNTGTTSPAVSTSGAGAPTQPAMSEAAGAAPVATILPSSGSTLPGRPPASATPSDGTGGAASEPTVADGGESASMVPASVVNMPQAVEMDAGANLTIAEVPEETEEPEEDDDPPSFGGSTSGPGAGGASTTPDDDPPDDPDTIAGFDYILAAYAYDDETSTATVDVSDGSVCLSGTAVDAGANFDNWGAGLGLQLAAMEGEVPFDAEEAGISSVTFTVTGDIGVALRVGVNTVSEPNAAIGRGLAADDLDGPGTYTVQFSSLYQPDWEANTSGAALDQTDIDSVQFQTTSVQGSSTSFDFCIEDVSFD